MTSTTTIKICSNGDHMDVYEELGNNLLQALLTYSQRLRQENLSMLGLFPNSSEISKSLSEEGRREKGRVIELAQEILATTIDPTTSLLLDSLQFHFCSCLKVVLDLGVGHQMRKDEQKSLEQLAKAVGADQALLTRIMRVVMTKYVFAEPQPGVYCHTSISWEMQEPAMHHLLLHRLDEGFRSASREPDALRLNNYRDPLPDDMSGFNLAFDCSENFWEFIANTDIKRGHRFNQAMKAVTINSLAEIPSLFPFASLAKDGGLIVDIGGGLGQVSRHILSCNPGAGLRCVVQDQHAFAGSLPKRPDEVDVHEKENEALALEFQQHNFFDPQPVRAYFFRHIFHDWSDTACLKILRQIIPAMHPQHSRILICDQIVGDKSPSVSSVLYDVDMMTLFGGKERSLLQFLDLIKAADQRFYIDDVKRSAGSATTIIVVKLSS
ncbi:hypothetical protein GGP41_002272 [Bipolaris sorokiniana]|uniref:O-methyltransferase domain-containing protein n=1 Tax=Cochliobolus sativus TaxID=45130 RepID=A0A8H5Z7D9_COCSA|nr:hypothetical protein GGP41_002272 [Bipolaris sorokiniana]